MCLLLFFEKALAGKEELQRARQKVYLLIRKVQLPFHFVEAVFLLPEKGKVSLKEENKMTMSALIRDVEAKLGRKIETEVVVKNGVELEGIRLSDETFTPIVYPGEFPEEMEYAEMVNGICEIFEVFLQEKGSGTAVESFENCISEKESLMENIFVGMQRSGSEDIVKRESEFPGIEEYLHVRQDVSDGCYSAKVKEEILKNAGVTLEEAWTAAEKNTAEEAVITPMSEMLGIPGLSNAMFILTNTGGLKGASSIIAKSKIKEVANSIGVERFVAIPSSIHEWILVPHQDGEDMSRFDEMVLCANKEAVDVKDQLGDRAYVLEC